MCLDTQLVAHDFHGKFTAKWTLADTIRYIKVIDGEQGLLLAGCRNGDIVMIDIREHGTAVNSVHNV